MKRTVFFTFVLFAMLSLALSCTGEMTGDGLDSRDSIQSQTVRQEIEITATAADNLPGTKTARIDKKFYWSPGDAISLFYGPGDNGGSMFVSTNTDFVDRTTFRGSIDVITGLMEGSNDIKFWGVFPYDQDNSCVDEGSAIITTIQSSQETAYNSWGQTQSVCIGRSDGLAMGFYNLCGGIIFCISQEGINRVTFRGNNDETIAGQVKVAMDGSNHPAITQFLGNEKEITVTAPNNFTPISGRDTTWYYLMLPPKTFSSGFTFTLYNDSGQYVENVTTKSRTVNRNVFGVMRTPLDKGLTFTDVPPQNNQINYTATEQITYHTANTSNVVDDANCTWDSGTGKGVIAFVNPITAIDNNAFMYARDYLTSVTFPEGVTEIGTAAFQACDNLITVGLPGTLTNIRAGAFGNCTALSEINLPEGLVHIGETAFMECESLESVHLPSTLVLDPEEGNPFAGCMGIQSFSGKYSADDGKFLIDPDNHLLLSAALGNSALTGDNICRIPDGVTAIGANALYCLQCNDIDLNDVVTIGPSAFQLTNLKTVTIPETVTQIGDHAFSWNIHMTFIEFKGDNLPEIGQNTFGGAGSDPSDYFVFITGFATIASWQLVGGDSPWFTYRFEARRISVMQDDDEIWYHLNGDMQTMQFSSALNFGSTEYPAYRAANSGVIIPSTWAEGLNRAAVVPTSMTIDDNTVIGIQLFDAPVTSVPKNAFKDKTDLDYLSLPFGVTTIGDYAFNNTALITFPLGFNTNLTSIGSFAFSGCSQMTFSGANFIYMRKLTSLGESAFSECNAFGSTEQPKSILFLGQLQSIPVSAFENCYNLTHIAICNPANSGDANSVNSLTTIGRQAFAGCVNLVAINTEANWREEVFNLPGVSSIGNNTFSNCWNMKSINLSSGLLEIPDGAFEYCKALTGITLPSGLKFIDDSAFYGCTGLTSIALPSSLEGVGLRAANHQLRGINPFAGCTSLKKFSGGNNTAAIIASDGQLLCNEYGQLISAAGDIGGDTPIIPNWIRTICKAAFEGSNTISIDIPANVTEVADYAFKNCSDLIGVLFDDQSSNYTCPSIGNETFTGTPASMKVKIPGIAASTISSYEYWPSLVTSGKVVVYQSDQEIWYCCPQQPSSPAATDGKILNLQGNGMSPDMFSGIIPSALASTSRPNVARPESITETIIYVDRYSERIYGVDAEAFKDNTDATYISLPQLVRSIGNDAFRGCSALKIFPAASNQWTSDNVLTTIGSGAFYGCSEMTGDIDLPYVTTIGEKAFGMTRSLTQLKLGANLTTLGDSLFYDDDPNLRNKGKLQLYLYTTNEGFWDGAINHDTLYFCFRYDDSSLSELEPFKFFKVFIPYDQYEEIVNTYNLYTDLFDTSVSGYGFYVLPN